MNITLRYFFKDESNLCNADLIIVEMQWWNVASTTSVFPLKFVSGREE